MSASSVTQTLSLNSIIHFSLGLAAVLVPAPASVLLLSLKDNSTECLAAVVVATDQGPVPGASLLLWLVALLGPRAPGTKYYVVGV